MFEREEPKKEQMKCDPAASGGRRGLGAGLDHTEVVFKRGSPVPRR